VFWVGWTPTEIMYPFQITVSFSFNYFIQFQLLICSLTLFTFIFKKIKLLIFKVYSVLIL
jgi:hypothetical protein